MKNINFLITVLFISIFFIGCTNLNPIAPALLQKKNQVRLESENKQVSFKIEAKSEKQFKKKLSARFQNCIKAKMSAYYRNSKDRRYARNAWYKIRENDILVNFTVSGCIYQFIRTPFLVVFGHLGKNIF